MLDCSERKRCYMMNFILLGLKILGAVLVFCTGVVILLALLSKDGDEDESDRSERIR